MKHCIWLLLLTCATAIGQKQKVQYYVYDKDWKGVKDVASAEYVVEARNIGDSVFVNRIFKGRGHLWRQESFSDADQTMPNGQFAWYDDAGRIDSAGHVSKTKKDGNWSYYDDTLGIYLSVTYENGKEVERRDYTNKVIRTPGGEKTFDEEKKERDSYKEKEVALKVEEKEAVFKGGPAAYKKYLEKNIEVPADIVKTGPVKIQFIINKNGKFENPLILRSLQLTADIEALRVLSEMPDWTPAVQNGKNVYYQAIQYITFQAN